MSEVQWQVLLGTHDVTGYVNQITFGEGLRQPYGFMADVGVATVFVNNAGGAFSPELGSGTAFGTQNTLAISATLGTTTYGLWTGEVRGISVETGFGKMATIECVDAMEEFTLETAAVEFAEDITLHDAVCSVQCEYGVDLNVTDAITIPVFDARTQKSIAQTLRDLAVSTYGKFAVVNGTLTYFDKHTFLGTANALTGVVPMNADYSYGRYLQNEVVVRVYPRVVSASDDETILEQRLDARVYTGEAKSYRLWFNQSDTDTTTSVQSISSVVIKTNHKNYTLTIVEETATGLEIEVENTGSAILDVTTATVRGKFYRVYAPVEVAEPDEASITANKRRKLEVEAEYLQSLLEARAIAEYEIARQGVKHGVMASVTLGERVENRTAMVAAGIGSKVRVADAQSGHDRVYTVVGREWSASDGLAQLQTTLYLEPADVIDVLEYDTDNYDGGKQYGF